MGRLNDVITQLHNLVAGIQYSGNSAFVDIFDHATNAFSGYPSATIVNAEVLSTYDTQAQNFRTYVINLYVYENLEQLDDAEAWTRIRDEQDLILDAIDRSLDLQATADFIRPTAAQPFESTAADGGKLLVAPIRIEAALSVMIIQPYD